MNSQHTVDAHSRRLEAENLSDESETVQLRSEVTKRKIQVSMFATEKLS